MAEINIEGYLLNSKANNTLSNVTSAAISNLNSVGARTVSQSWTSGASFYRVYSDGFIEQGGYAGNAVGMTITLNKAFTTTNYNIQITCARVDAGSAPASAAFTVNKTKTTFQATGNNASTASYWFACGF